MGLLNKKQTNPQDPSKHELDLYKFYESIIKEAILEISLECTSRRGVPEGTVFSPAYAARKKAKEITEIIRQKNTLLEVNALINQESKEETK